MSFLQAASFQWVNPKGWMSTIGTVATYTPANGFFLNLLTVTILFVLIMSACTSVWTGMGSALRGFLTNPVALRVFNIAMALLLVASLYPIVTGKMG
jgi:threonine/homoserine/homoserine lactone efflux protein